MSNVVEILVKGTDHSKPAMDSAERGTNKLGKATDGAKRSLGLFKVAAGAVAGAGLVGFLKDATQGWQDHEKNIAQTAAVIKSTGGSANVTVKQIDDLSNAIEAQTGIDNDNVEAGANMLLTFTNIRNGVGKGNDVFNQSTKTLADLSAAMGTDMKTSAIQLGKALNDPVAGISALSRVGVTFDAQQKKTITTLVKTGHTMDAQKIILKELNKEFGGSAASQQTASSKMASAWRNIQDQVGQILLPILNKLASWAAKTFLPAVSMAISWLEANWPRIAGTIAAAWNGYIFPVFSAIVGFVRNQLIPGIQLVVSWVVAHWPQISAAFVMVWAQIKPVVDALIALLVTLWHTVLEPIVAWVQKHWAVISQVFKVAFVAMGVTIKIFLVILKTQIDMATVIIKGLAAAVNWLWHSIVMPVFNAIKAYIQVQMAVVRGAINTTITVVRGIGSAFSTAYHSVATWIGRIVSTITGLPGKISGLAGRMLQAGKTLMGGLFNGIKAAGGGVADIGKAIVNSVIDFLNTILPHHIGINKGPIHVNVPLFPNISHVRTGGIVSGDAVMNEDGGERVRLPNGSSVFSRADTQRLLAGAGGGGPIVLEIRSGGSRLDDLMVELIRRAVRVRGGGDVQLALGN